MTDKNIIKDSPNPPKIGDVVEGPIIDIDHGRVYIDIHPFGTAVIYGREYMAARDLLKHSNIGDIVEAKVVDTENEDGYLEVSLREARQALIWNEAQELMRNKTVLELSPKEANKGGLIMEWKVLPASQLNEEHYPKVPEGDKDKILSELKALVGQKLQVYIITADAKEQKLIFSEKVAGQTEVELEESISEVDSKYKVGDILEGEITGATDFGIFVKLDDGLEGLVHISEMDWALVEDPKTRYKVGERVQVKVIEVKGGKVSLSIKALKEDPWTKVKDKYKKGGEVDAVIIKHNRHGALASVEEGVSGLVHVSEFESPEDLREKLQLGSSHKFVITMFEPEEHKMTLSYKQANKEQD
jgi:ribosomal protein S1